MQAINMMMAGVNKSTFASWARGQGCEPLDTGSRVDVVRDDVVSVAIIPQGYSNLWYTAGPLNH